MLSFFDFTTVSIGEGYPKHNISIIHQKNSYISIFVNSYHIILFTIFCVYSTHWHHRQGNWLFLQILPIKKSTPTLHKHVLSYSANHTSYTTNSTPTIMSHQLQHKESPSIQNTEDISNTDDIHSCVTPPKQNISVQATSTPPCLTPLITTLPLLPVEWPKTTHLTPLGKEYLCFQVDKKSPLLLNVSNQVY